MVGISAGLNPAVVLIVTDGYQPVTQNGAAPIYAKQQGAGYV